VGLESLANEEEESESEPLALEVDLDVDGELDLILEADDSKDLSFLERELVVEEEEEEEEEKEEEERSDEGRIFKFIDGKSVSLLLRVEESESSE